MKILKYGILIFFLLFISPKVALGQESIESFDSNIRLHSDGTMAIVETIKYDFGEIAKHGIFRYIPLTSRVGGLYKNIKIDFKNIQRDGLSENYQSHRNLIWQIKSDANFGDHTVSVKIGDPDKTIKGLHTYTISYKIRPGVTNFADHDELYWNINGNGWNVPIKQISSLVTSDIGHVMQTKCFKGILGSLNQDCQNSATALANQASFSASDLLPSEGLTILVSYPANTFPKTELSQTPLGTISPNQWILIGVLSIVYYLVLPLYIFLWYLTHKRKKSFGKPVVNFDIPQDKGQRISPAEAGTIDTSTLAIDDVTATIFDLAIRKYLKLVAKEKDKSIFGIHQKSTQHRIEKITEKDIDDLSEFEKSLYKKIFRNSDSTQVSSLAVDFYQTFETMQKLVFTSLVTKGFYIKDPKTQRSWLILGGILVLITLNIFLAAELFWFAKVLNGRTKLGDEVDFAVDGLKIFLKNMAREYKFQVKNLITVEKYIPYAISLGYIDEFMEQLKIIYPDYNPAWYTGSQNGFYNFYPLFYSEISTSIPTSATSSASGFSSGGFCGGGGGGGGGGSW